MYGRVRPNVLNERDPGHQRGAPVGIDPGSLSQHMALIFPPPACLSSSFLRPLRRQRLTHELCGNIDQLIESYCVEPWVIIEGRITPTLVLCACALQECVIQLCVTHTCVSLSSPQVCNGYASVQGTYGSLRNQHGPNDCLH